MMRAGDRKQGTARKQGINKYWPIRIISFQFIRLVT